jgi:hypothetical protein
VDVRDGPDRGSVADDARDNDELVRILVRERSEHDGIDDAVDRRVGGDGQRQDGDDHRRSSALAGNQARPEAHVPPDVVEPGHRPASLGSKTGKSGEALAGSARSERDHEDN